MPWARFDDTAADHRKIIDAGNEAVGAWFRMTVFCARELTDGRLSARQARNYAGSDAMLTELVTVGLLDREGDGYVVHDYLEYNPTAEEVRTTRAARAAAGEEGARKTNAKRAAEAAARAAAKASALAAANAVATAAANASAKSRPDPDPDPDPGSQIPKPVPIPAGARVERNAGVTAGDATSRPELRPLCRELVSTAARAGAMGGEMLAGPMAEMLAATPEARADPADYARRLCEAYDAYRVSCHPNKRPSWAAEALRRHWPTLGRILAGADPWPAPWTPEAAKPKPTGYQPPAPKQGSIIAGDG